MFRHFACLAALLLAAASANAQSLKLQLLSADGDILVGDEEITQTRFITEKRIRTVNGRDETYTVTVPVPVTFRQKVSYPMKNVTVFDLDGVKIDPDKVPELLRKPKPVVISYIGKIDRSLRDALKDGTLIVVPPLPSAAPKMPEPPSRGPFAPPIPGVPVKPKD